MPENQLILIADDYGLSPGINAGILTLLDEKRLSGTSVLVNLPDFISGAPALQKFEASADIGLHLNLTAGQPLSEMPNFAPHGTFPDLDRMMRSAWINRLDHAEIAREINAQLDHFKAHMGFMPYYIDGHQHVHIFPVVRDALFHVLASRPDYKPWLRSPFDHPLRIINRGVMVRKSLIIAALSLRFHRLAKSRSYLTNSSFSGASDFNPRSDYGAFFKRYLRAPTRHHLVMCHPGHVAKDDRFPDMVRDTRPIEFEFLMRAEFWRCLEEAHLELGLMRKLSS